MILIFDNLHWASESLLDLVEHLSSARASTSLLFITLSRPELLDRRPTWGGGRQNFTSLALQPLSAKRTRELVKRLAPDLPSEVNAKIAESAAGNPFFAQELVRGLAERGLTGAAALADVLPDTVRGAVLARLDLLAKMEREVLQVASVASRNFPPTLLQQVLPQYSAEAIERALNGLLTRDMLAPAAGGTFTFPHALVLDVTYDTLSRAERIRLHSRIAAVLLEEAGEQVDECVELLAHHYARAVQLSKMSAVPQKLEVETERAITFQVRAAELASRAGASHEALAYFQSAIDLASDAEKVTLYEKLGDSLAYQWRFKIFEAYHQALALWHTLPEPHPLVGARLMRKMIITDIRGGVAKLSPEEIEAFWQEGLYLAKQAGDEQEQWKVRVCSVFMSDTSLRELGVVEMQQHAKVQELKQLAAEAASYFEQQQDWEAFSETLDGYALLLFRTGENSAALATTQRRLQVAGLPFSERLDAIATIVLYSFASGEYETGRQVMEEALGSFRPGDPFEGVGNALGGILWIQYLTGHWSEIARFRQPLDEICKRVQDIEGAGIPVANGYQALVLMALSHEDHAEVEALLALLGQLAPQFFAGKDAMPLVSMYRDGDFSQFQPGKRGQSMVGILMMLFTEHEQYPPDELFQMSDYSADDLTLRASNIAKALKANDSEALDRAIDEAEEHQLIVHAARMRIVLAKRSSDLSQLKRARPVLEQLEDRLFLRKLHEVEVLLQVT